MFMQPIFALLLRVAELSNLGANKPEELAAHDPESSNMHITHQDPQRSSQALLLGAGILDRIA